MSRATVFLLFTCLNAGFVLGMDCTFGQSSNILVKWVKSCPGPFDSDEKSFCCIDGHDSTYCCDAAEFALKTWLGIIVPIVITIGIIVSLIVCCISCLCCSCCPWYRRRHHQGTVYGRVQVPSVVQVIQTPANVEVPAQNQYSTNATGMPQAPPQYTNEMYAKQAPYNPNYVQ